MKPDHLIEEIHKYRTNHARKFDCNLDEIFSDIKKAEKASGRDFVSRSPRKIMNPAVNA